MKFLNKGVMNFQSALLAAALVFVVLVSSGWSQDVYQQISRTDRLVKQYPAVYAITNVRIVVGNGEKVGNSTIIIKNGLIDAISPDVQIPEEAVEIDGVGLTVYPGFIDVHTNLGFGSSQARGGGFAQQRPTQPQQQQQQEEQAEPNTRSFDANLRPDKTAIDDIDFNDNNFKTAREAGVTAALSINRQGVFPGKSSVVSTFVDDPLRGVIKGPLFQFIQYSNIRSGYPSTLMAVVAFQRQLLMDAQYFMDIEARYEKSARGMPRPVYDSVLRDLFPVVRGEETVIIPVTQENDIIRAVNLAKQFNLKYMLSGVVEGYRVIELLKEENVPLIVSVNYPQPRSTTGYAFNMPFTPYEKTPPPGGARQERGEEPNEELSKAIEAKLHGNANTLYQAGIPFVLSSGGLYDDFLEHLRQAVNAGLPADVALAKLTTESAEFLGVSDVLGTVELGKIANLILADGDLLDEKTVIRHVFVDGKKVDVVIPPAETGESRGRILETTPEVTIDGTWNLTMEFGTRTSTMQMVLKRDGSKLTGTISSQLGEAAISNGTIEGDKISFSISLGEFSLTFKGTVSGKTMKGTAAAGEFGTFDWSATKPGM